MAADLKPRAKDPKPLFGAAVKPRRVLLELSQEELAWRAGLHRTYGSDVERGARNLSLESICKLASALEIPAVSLLSDSENVPGHRANSRPTQSIDGPVVMLTYSREDRDVIESYRVGVNGYVVKPVDFEKFSDAITRLGSYWLQVNHSPA